MIQINKPLIAVRVTTSHLIRSEGKEGVKMNQETVEKINRRQRQILVHSCLYYQFNENLIQDHVYDAWSKELAELIQNYPKEFKGSVYYSAFKGYDGCSGFDLPFSDPRIVGVAEGLLHNKRG